MGSKQKRLPKVVIERMMTLMLGGFAFVAALAWNDAIQSLVQRFFDPESSGIQAKFFYAVIITVIITVVSLRLSRFTGEDTDPK